MKRKLGKKNIILFAIIFFLFIGIIGVFIYFINYELKKDDNTYDLSSGSILFDNNYNYIEVKNGGTVKKGFDRNYYLTYKEDKTSYKQKIGTNTIVYKEGDYILYLYGTAYMISSTGEVEKVTNQTQIVKANSPYFFKISDRKYLFVDKKLGTSDGSIKTTDYLIIDIDKKGNATFINFENNIKTIKPLILKGTKFDFDIANEMLLIDKDNKIDLKTIIGSTNEYAKKEEEKENNNKNENNYYDEYLNTIKNNFNNLIGSINGINENIQGEINKEDAYLDLTRWTILKEATSYVNSINLKYNVFDPNNEYSSIFAYIINGENTEKIQLSKSNDSYIISNLIPDTQYNIKYGYRLINSLGGGDIDIITDNIKVKTKSINYQILIKKITTNKIYYTVTFNNNYIPDSVLITLYSNDNEIGNKIINRNEIDKNGTYDGYFNYTTMDYIVSLKLNNVIYDGKEINYSTISKFIN